MAGNATGRTAESRNTTPEPSTAAIKVQVLFDMVSMAGGGWPAELYGGLDGSGPQRRSADRRMSETTRDRPRRAFSGTRVAIGNSGRQLPPAYNRPVPDLPEMSRRDDELATAATAARRDNELATAAT